MAIRKLTTKTCPPTNSCPAQDAKKSWQHRCLGSLSGSLCMCSSCWHSPWEPPCSSGMPYNPKCANSSLKLLHSFLTGHKNHCASYPPSFVVFMLSHMGVVLSEIWYCVLEAMWEPNPALSKALGLEEMQTEALLNKDKARPPAPADTQASKATLGTSVRERHNKTTNS